jgi:hypothetical protein
LGDFVQRFYSLLNIWRSDTAFFSDPDLIVAHPAFQALVELAGDIVPLAIEDLRARPSNLVWVLDDAIGEVEYPRDIIGDLVAMSNAWIDWAERNGRTL